MMLINGAVSTGAARVRQVSTDRALEEALAAFARGLSVVLPGTLVAADDTLHARRRRKSARDVTARRRALSMLMCATAAIVVVAAAVANSNGHLLDEVLGADHRRHRRSCAVFPSASVILQ